MKDYIEIFSNFFEKGGWKGDGESVSGIGSSLAYTQNFRKNLLRIIKEYNIQNIFDCSCGDWNWMKEIKKELPVYIGNDVVKKIVDQNNSLYGTEKISFVFGDMLTNLKKYKDKEIDLCISRHTFEHLPQNYCIDVINEIKRVSKYSLITTNNTLESQNTDIEYMLNGDSRAIFLHEEPYINLLGNPLESFFDSVGEPQAYGCFANLYKF